MSRDPAPLAIVGSWPPPYGGVAVHVQRLSPLLTRAGVGHVIYNATSDVGDGDRVIGVYSRRRTWLLHYALTAREPAIYMMSGRLSAWVVSALMAAIGGKRVALRLRNSSLPDWIAQSWWRRTLLRWTLRRMDAVVCVSKLLAETVQSLGIPPDRIHWSPGFLPPGDDLCAREQVAPAVWTFLADHSPVIAANGKVDAYDGVDLYGLDHLVELAARLKPDYPRLGIVICFWDHLPEDQSELERLQRRAKELGVAGNVLFNTTSGLFVPVLAAADVFVRPTNTDGDANSVREALYLGMPAVASDAVARPAGTRLFRTRDLDDFEAKVRTALADARPAGQRPEPRPGDEDRAKIEAYVGLLKRLAEGTPVEPVSNR